MQLVDQIPLCGLFISEYQCLLDADVGLCAVAFIKELIPAQLDPSQTTSQCKQGQRDILITTGNVILTAP